MDKIVVGFCRYLQKALAFFHKGSSLPGKIVLEYNNKILRDLADKYRVILVTGTNGKTTTASLLAKIIKDAGFAVIHNSTGANMLSGVMTLFIQHKNDYRKKFAVVEIDEASLPLYTKIAGAKVILCTNIFKDQLDRYGEIYTTFAKLKNGIEVMPEVKMILNGDEPLFGLIKGNTVYYGFEEKPPSALEEEKSNVEGQFCINCREKYHYDFRTYNHLGKYRCKKCGYQRPALNNIAKSVSITDDSHLKFCINDGIIIRANMGGVYNVYNILAAYTAARELGVPDDVITKSISSFEPRFGRAEEFFYNGKKIKIILVKNPVSLNQGLRIPCFNRQEKCGVFILNDNGADGRDISWIWDVDFENNLTEYKNVFVAGSRKYDMALRLKIAGYQKENTEIFCDLKTLIRRIKTYNESNFIYIFATYTAMLELRRLLAEEKMVKHAW